MRLTEYHTSAFLVVTALEFKSRVTSAVEASSCVDAVVITAAIVASAFIYIWVIKQIDGANILKWRIVFSRRISREVYTTDFYSLQYLVITNFYLNQSDHLLRTVTRKKFQDMPRYVEMEASMKENLECKRAFYKITKLLRAPSLVDRYV